MFTGLLVSLLFVTFVSLAGSTTEGDTRQSIPASSSGVNVYFCNGNHLERNEYLSQLLANRSGQFETKRALLIWLNTALSMMKQKQAGRPIDAEGAVEIGIIPSAEQDDGSVVSVYRSGSDVPTFDKELADFLYYTEKIENRACFNA